MTHTLWRGSELLGEARLGPAPGGAGVLAGPFRPAPGFAAVWPAFRAVQEAGAAAAAALDGLPPSAGPDAIRARLLEHGAGAATGAALAGVEALGLTVRDAAGSELAGMHAVVGSWAVPLPNDLTPEQRAEAERDAAAAGVVLSGPNYVLTVMPRAGGPASRPHAA